MTLLDYKTEKIKIDEFFKNLSEDDFQASLDRAGLSHYKNIKQVVFSGEYKMILLDYKTEIDSL